LGRRERQEPHRDLCHPRATAIISSACIASGALPRAKAVATPEIVNAMRENYRRLDRQLLAPAFPGEIPDRLLVAEPLEDNELELEGHKLVA